MRTNNRKSAPEVAGGRVQKKNNHALTPNYYSHPPRELVVDRKRPGKGYRHILTCRDVRKFITLLPEWGALSEGLEAIVLAPGEADTHGFHCVGVVHVCAWEEDLWIDYERDTDFYHAHEPSLTVLACRLCVLKMGMRCASLPTILPAPTNCCISCCTSWAITMTA